MSKLQPFSLPFSGAVMPDTFVSVIFLDLFFFFVLAQQTQSLGISTLDRDAALAHAIDERLHAAVEKPLMVGREAVEVEFLEALGLGTLGQECADTARGFPVVPLRVLRFEVLVERRRGADGVALLVVDDLGVDVVV